MSRCTRLFFPGLIFNFANLVLAFPYVRRSQTKASNPELTATGAVAYGYRSDYVSSTKLPLNGNAVAANGSVPSRLPFAERRFNRSGRILAFPGRGLRASSGYSNSFSIARRRECQLAGG